MMTNLEGVRIIVVGAGFGGLTAAIELQRKGASVQVFESTKQLTEQGDTIQLASNATKSLAKWGDVLQIVADDSAMPRFLECQDSQGQLLYKQPLPLDFDGFPVLYPSRGRAHKAIYDHAVSIGVRFRFGARVSSFFEDESQAGVYVGNERIVADAVLAANGVHSKARAFITGMPQNPASSGFAAYRCWFPVEVLDRNNPLLDDVINATEDRYWVWIGPDVHALVMTNVKLQWLACFCTHKDTYTAEESWSSPGDIAHLLRVVEGWDERLKAIFESIPPEKLIDWKLLWREPLSRWVSEHGRIALVGDSAHPHLPSSGQGAAQAIEDGAVIGATMDRAGKDVSLGLRAYEKIRYWRTNLTQRMGWELRHLWHRTDWEHVKKDPKVLEFRQPYWLFGGDPEGYAYEAYDEVVYCLKNNKEFVPKNVPEGYRHEEWTMEDMLKQDGSSFVVYD